MGRPGRKFGLALLCAVLSLGTALMQVPSAQAGVESGTFTKEEWRKLDAGETVIRSATRIQGGLRLMGGSSWQVIDAAPSSVWRALLDTSRYHKMMPEVLEARLVHKDAAQRTVFMRQGASGVLEARYYLKVHVYEDRQDITFSVDDHLPHQLLKAAWGFYTVRPYKGGKTLLAYGVMADIGEGLLAGVMRTDVHEWMLRTPWMVKRFLEGSGRRLYLSK
jgi:hypothetical protein